MDRKWKQLIIAAVLGLVIPGVLLASIPKDQPNEPTMPDNTETSPTGSTPEDVTLRVVMADGSLQQMDMDAYLTGVLLREMPGDFEAEALKAQAVVARTYALRRNASADKHAEGAVCVNSSCCQGYCDVDTYLAEGGTQETVDKMRRAVLDTANQVLTYNGTLIEATYFSCSGGKTEDAQAVWGADVPYLQAVDSPGEEEAAHYTDTVKFTAEEFKELLGSDLSGQPGEWIKSVTYTDGGGVQTIKIGNATYTGTTMRKLLGLRSTAFVITAAGDSIIITTKGFGHRVGMSQYGADAMAVLGSTYEEILAHYYQGTKLENWT